jgi:hypothetical protein
VDATTTSQIERLVTHFEAAGKLFCQVPLPSPQTSGTAIANAARLTQDIAGVLDCFEEIVARAELVLRDLNGQLVENVGGSRTKFLLTRFLEPTLFAALDGEALKKATSKAETPDFGEHVNHLNVLHQRTPKRKRLRPDTPPGAGVLPNPAVGNAKVCTVCHKTFTTSWSKHKKSGQCR